MVLLCGRPLWMAPFSTDIVIKIYIFNNNAFAGPPNKDFHKNRVLADF